MNILPSCENAKIVDGRIWVSIFSSKWRTGLSDVLSTLLDALPGHTNAKDVDGRIWASIFSSLWRTVFVCLMFFPLCLVACLVTQMQSLWMAG